MCGFPIALESRAHREHAGVSGEQPSVGTEMEAYGDQAADTSNQFCWKSSEEPCGRPVSATSCACSVNTFTVVRVQQRSLLATSYFSRCSLTDA